MSPSPRNSSAPSLASCKSTSLKCVNTSGADHLSGPVLAFRGISCLKYRLPEMRKTDDFCTCSVLTAPIGGFFKSGLAQPTSLASITSGPGPYALRMYSECLPPGVLRSGAFFDALFRILKAGDGRGRRLTRVYFAGGALRGYKSLGAFPAAPRLAPRRFPSMATGMYPLTTGFNAPFAAHYGYAPPDFRAMLQRRVVEFGLHADTDSARERAMVTAMVYNWFRAIPYSDFVAKSEELVNGLNVTVQRFFVIDPTLQSSFAAKFLKLYITITLQYEFLQHIKMGKAHNRLGYMMRKHEGMLRRQILADRDRKRLALTLDVDEEMPPAPAPSIASSSSDGSMPPLESVSSSTTSAAGSLFSIVNEAPTAMDIDRDPAQPIAAIAALPSNIGSNGPSGPVVYAPVPLPTPPAAPAPSTVSASDTLNDSPSAISLQTAHVVAAAYRSLDVAGASADTSGSAPTSATSSAASVTSGCISSALTKRIDTSATRATRSLSPIAVKQPVKRRNRPAVKASKPSTAAV
uniref:Uncharacterized protein n=1 Tax=Mycena chlorophos TaxID=658473 RepID=A0ABQ0KUL8_MYCCL|nr:predicted protein [Mycena chlorophos]